MPKTIDEVARERADNLAFYQTDMRYHDFEIMRGRMRAFVSRELMVATSDRSGHDNDEDRR